MSFQLMAWAARQRTGSPTRKAVLMALANATNHHTGLCNPSIETIAEETEFGETAIKRALKELCDPSEGVGLTRKRARRGDGSLSVYEYTFPDTARDAPPQAGKTSGPQAGGASQEPGEDLEPGGVDLHPSASPSDSDRPPAPALIKQDGRDIAFDALARACGIEERSPRMRDVGMAMSGDRRTTGIREQFWQESLDAGTFGPLVDASPIFERELADEIPRRAQLYKAVMSGATLTPRALCKWWTDLPGMAKESSIEGFYEQAQDAVNRAKGRT